LYKGILERRTIAAVQSNENKKYPKNNFAPYSSFQEHGTPFLVNIFTNTFLDKLPYQGVGNTAPLMQKFRILFAAR
jgi:hypothetical protein